MNKIFLTLLLIITILSSKAFAFEFFDNLSKVGEITTEIENIKNQNNELKKEIEKLKMKNETDEKIIESIWNNTLYLSNIFPRIAYIDPSSKGYDVIACKNGYFTVSCKNIKSYSTGSEITLQLVNMLSVIVSDAEITISYSTSKMFDENDKESYSKYESARKERKEKIMGDLLPATSKIVTFRAPEYKPDQIKIIEVSISVGGIRYRAN